MRPKRDDRADHEVCWHNVRAYGSGSFKLSFAAVMVIASIVSGVAVAEENRDGWRLEFRQDTFDKQIFPLAMISELGDGFDKALIAFACSTAGELIAFFQPERFMIFAPASKVQFRDGDATREFTFAVGEVSHLGNRLVVSAEESSSVAAIFERAAGADVPFRTDKKQGAFTSIGASLTFEIVREHCPK